MTTYRFINPTARLTDDLAERSAGLWGYHWLGSRCVFGCGLLVRGFLTSNSPNTLRERRAALDDIYGSTAPEERSWFEQTPQHSLEAIASCGIPPERPLVDVGGGTSALVAALLQRGWQAPTILDVSAKAITQAKTRMGEDAARIHWIVADVRTWQPKRQYGLWHDRAVLHFLTDPTQRRAYVTTLRTALAVGGCALISGFGPAGPDQCSRLPVERTDAAGLAALLGKGFALVSSATIVHRTPWDAEQSFVAATFRRMG